MDRVDPEFIRRLLTNKANIRPANSAKVTKETRDLDGNVLYKEQAETAIDAATMQPEIKILKETLKCSCGQPFDEHMLMSDQVRVCGICSAVTCVRCWANTNVTEYFKPQVRGQTICLSCWNNPTIMSQLMIKCPTCDHPVRNYGEIKDCFGWHERPHKICPSCGIPGQIGELVCRKCHPKYVSLMEVLKG
jgi:hypothetical protein